MMPNKSNKKTSGPKIFHGMSNQKKAMPEIFHGVESTGCSGAWQSHPRPRWADVVDNSDEEDQAKLTEKCHKGRSSCRVGQSCSKEKKRKM